MILYFNEGEYKYKFYNNKNYFEFIINENMFL